MFYEHMYLGADLAVLSPNIDGGGFDGAAFEAPKIDVLEL